MNWRPSRLSMAPQLGTLGGRPKPRKLNDASLMITPPMLMVNTTITTGAILGSTWRKNVFHRADPIDCAAWK